MRWIAGLLAIVLATGAAKADEFRNGGFSFETGPAPGFVDERPSEAQWPADAPGADDNQWRYWRYDMQVDRRPGQDATYTDYIYEPRSQGNMADAGRFEISFNPDYQQLTLHRVELRRDGRWQSRMKPAEISIARRERQFEQDISDGQVAALIVIEDVRPGDVVRISWTVAGSNPILAGQFSEQTYLAYGHPILDIRLRTLYPPGTAIADHRENGAPPPRIERRADATVVEAGATRVARLLNDGDYPVWFQPNPLVQFAPERSWADVVQWALPLYPDQSGLALPGDLQKRIDEWKAIPSAAGRLQAALRAVQDEVRYFGVETGTSSHKPRPPDLVWQRRYGDCKDKAWLLATVLGRLGIHAVPALVDTRRGRGVRDFAPAADVFDHVIVRAQVDGEPVFVDPTMRLQGGAPRDGDLSSYGFVLPVEPGQRELAEILPPREPAAGVVVRERYAPTTGEQMRLDVTTEYRGVNADRMRRSLDDERLEDRSRRYREYYGKRLGPVEELQPQRIEDDRAGNVIVVRESYALASPWQDADGTRGLDLGADALSGVADLPARTERNGPLFFARPGRYLQEVTVAAPKGWLPRFAREEERVEAAAFDYHRTLERDGDNATLRLEMQVRERNVPLADVPAHIRDLRKVGDGLSSRLRYRAPASAEAADREARLKNLLQDMMKEQ